jgi:hypothetical protein
MSAIQQLPDPRERRRAERLAVNTTIDVFFGRGPGVLVDLSQSGARIRHSSPVQRGASARISFEWERRRFSATATVLAARVISLGAALSYESRVHFSAVSPESEQVLAAALESMTGSNVRRWVANLHGWSEESQAPAARPTASFIRCRLRSSWWERKCTSDTVQPPDGFLLPAEAKETEIATLCDSYVRAGEEERELIRSMAAAAVEHATSTSVLPSSGLDGSTRRRGVLA